MSVSDGESVADESPTVGGSEPAETVPDGRSDSEETVPDGGQEPGELRPEDPVEGSQISGAGGHTEPSVVERFPERDLDLRSGADPCYKCTTCDISCPVAAVDDEFPGPKFQGPEQWRLKRKEETDIDESITACSNCMRCDSACPSGVPLSQMHNEARGEYVDEQLPTVSRTYVRNRILANYRTIARIASHVPRLANAVLDNPVTKWVNETVLGVTSERNFPSFATQTFREWWRERGGASVTNDEKRVAYFHGCYSNYNTPEVAKAMVRVYEHFGYEIMVPTQRCSGTPMFANGMLSDARRAAETNVEHLASAIDNGADVVASCTSCSLSLRQEYPELFDIDRIDDVATNTFEALEYLRIHEDLAGAVRAADVETDYPALAYHAPCHARNQGLHRQVFDVFKEADPVTVEDVGDSCSGISGTYGWKAEKYETSMDIGEEMFDHMHEAEGDVGLTECPTCAMQMEHGTGYDVRHPLQVLEDVLVD
ncbi:MAG: anaerobic glycerol-3-phosphate dehydrogenase subunit C [Halodesulfurarchaeum sp.]